MTEGLPFLKQKKRKREGKESDCSSFNALEILFKKFYHEKWGTEKLIQPILLNKKLISSISTFQKGHLD